MPDTAMPIDDAARSLDRTASILRPVPARMMLHTSTKAIVTTTSTKMPKGSRAMFWPLRTDRSMPNSFGLGIRLAVASRICGLAKTNFSSVNAAASVTTASCAPRMRSAGRPTMTPASMANTAASSIEMGKGIAVPTLDSTRPATPANAA